MPGVVYGHHTEPAAFQVPVLALRPLIYSAEMRIVDLKIEGKQYNCIMKAVEFHPVTDTPIHVDFQVLERGERLTLTIPVQYHGTPAGQKEGGDTQIIVHELEVSCLPQDIVSHIDVEIGHLQIGDAIHVSDLELEGLDVYLPPQQTLVTIVPPRVLEVEEEEAAALELAEGEEVPTAEGEEGESEDEIADKEL